ncbi:MAG: phospho-N-acetylmuramoyl-pentapeptide-transferase [Candidatus Brocadiia bacterium]
MLYGLLLLDNILLRAGLSFLTALVVSLVAGSWLIRFFHRKNVIEDTTQPDHAGLNAIQSLKKDVPTMGGLMILAGIVVATLLWADLKAPTVWIGLLVLVVLGGAGLVDDYIKLRHKPSRGLTKIQKLVVQFILGGVVGYLLMRYWNGYLPVAMAMSWVRIPLTGIWLDFGWWYILWSGFVMAATSNAVNITDGLDGLAGGLMLIAMMFMTFLGLWELVSHSTGAEFTLFLENHSVLCACSAGAVLGFLWYNCNPAQIFMGDTGSLALGGLLAYAGLCMKAEFLLLVVGGVFFIEELTVAMQIASFKLTKKRVFPITPIHHYFQVHLKWPEQKIVTRAWFLGAFAAFLALLIFAARD